MNSLKVSQGHSSLFNTEFPEYSSLSAFFKLLVLAFRTPRAGTLVDSVMECQFCFVTLLYQSSGSVSFRLTLHSACEGDEGAGCGPRGMQGFE